MADKKKSEAKKKVSKKWKAYDTSGSAVVRKLKSCPKCGEGVHLAKHSDRQSCGRCGYTEIKEVGKPQAEENVKTEKKE